MSLERNLNSSKVDEKLHEMIKSLPSDLKLNKYFQESFLKAQQKVLPDLIAVVNKNIQMTRIIEKCNHSHGSNKDDLSNARRSEFDQDKLASMVKRRSVLMPNNQFLLS